MEGGEERQALDVVPVEVTDQGRSAKRRTGARLGHTVEAQAGP